LQKPAAVKHSEKGQGGGRKPSGRPGWKKRSKGKRRTDNARIKSPNVR
jgi:hypothetical protein